METLSLSIIKQRDTFLRKFKELTLDKLSLKLKELLESEKDEIKRIVILASRVETIRKRIETINPIKIIKKIPENNKVEKEPDKKSENINVTDVNKDQDWIRVIITSSTEVNGVRFPEGIQVDVTKNDSERLISSGKASLIT